MRTIELTQNQVALVSDCDYEWLSKWKWTASRRRDGDFYAVRMPPRNKRRARRLIYMHREIMHAPDGIEVDHINGDPKDNRQQNLRLCNRAENAQNQKTQVHSSRFRGVSWDKARCKWRTSICANGKRRFLGRFTSEKDAVAAHNTAAIKYHGAFCTLSYP